MTEKRDITRLRNNKAKKIREELKGFPYDDQRDTVRKMIEKL